MFEGSPAKTVRIVQSKDPLSPKKSHAIDDPCWKHTFSEAVQGQGQRLPQEAPDDPKMQCNAAMKLDEDSKRDERGNETYVIQHSQILRHDGAVPCDILIMRSNLSHHGSGTT